MKQRERIRAENVPQFRKTKRERAAWRLVQKMERQLERRPHTMLIPIAMLIGFAGGYLVAKQGDEPLVKTVQEASR